jgi:predicted Holliday junction resolvase-like endonuclease
MLILALILACLSFGLWRAGVRARKETAGKADELNALRASLEDFRATVQKQAADSLESQLSVFRTSELRAAVEIARKEVKLEYDSKLAREIEKQRAEAIKQSKAVNRGLVAEQLAPHMQNFPYSPKDCLFIGKPFDYLVFDGLDAGDLKRIVLLEVKTGKSQANAREKQVRAAVEEARVQYDIFRLDTSDFT